MPKARWRRRTGRSREPASSSFESARLPVGCSALFACRILRSTSAELLRIKRHKLPDAHRRPAVTRSTPSVSLSYRPAGAARPSSQDARSGAPVLPAFSAPVPNPPGRCQSTRHHGSARPRIPGRPPMHVLRPRTGEFVDPAQVRHGVGEDGSDYLSDISRGNREVLPRPNGSSMRPRSRTVGPARGKNSPGTLSAGW